MCLSRPLTSDDLGSLLEALARCRSLRALNLRATYCEPTHARQPFPASGCPAFAKLHRLTKLEFFFSMGRSVLGHPIPLTSIVSPLGALTGLAVLKLSMSSGILPAALGQLRGLQSLQLHDLRPCVLEAGCFNLPKLQSLELSLCWFEDAVMLTCITSLQSLTFFKFRGFRGVPVLAQLVHLPRLEHINFDNLESYHWAESLEPARLPADMGCLCSALLRLSFRNHDVTEFPPALTQLVALQWLCADMNEFTKLPTAMTALSRLTKLDLGRVMSEEDPLQLHVKRPLDVRALGDLSALPALRELSFSFCELMFCESLPSAVHHASLMNIYFRVAHPAPECTPKVIWLSKERKNLKRGSVLRFVSMDRDFWITCMLQEAQGRSPYQKFMAAVK